MIAMFGERARHTNAHLALFAKESHLLVRVALAHDVLLDLELIDGVIGRDLHLLMGLHAPATHQLLTLDAFGGGVAFLVVDALANVAEGYLGRPLRQEQLVEAADEKVVVEFAHAAARYHRLLAANRTRELAIVRVLVRALRRHVLLDALLAERVQTRQAFRLAEVLEADLAREELVVYLLGELNRLDLCTRHRRCRR